MEVKKKHVVFLSPLVKEQEGLDSLEIDSSLNTDNSFEFIAASSEQGLMENSDKQDFLATISTSKKLFSSLSTSSSSTMLDRKGIINVSDFYYIGNEVSSTSPWYTTSATESINEVVLSAIGGDNSSNRVNEDGEVNGQDYTMSSLPADFTEISELNKNCIAVYTVLFFLAAVGNLMVLFSVTRQTDRVGKSRTPLLILNLCIADLIVTFFLIPTEIFWRLTIAWKGGEILCKLCQFFRAFGLYLSSFIIICISVDRYFAIVYPLKLAGAVKRVKWMLVGAWISSAVLAAPQIFIYHVATHHLYKFQQCVTHEYIKTGTYNELIYNISSISALYFIPLIVIIYTYTMILWKIHQKSREHQVANSQEGTRNDIAKDHGDHRSSCNHVNNPSQTKLLAPPTNESPSFHRTNSFLRRSTSKRTRVILRSSANQTATLLRARSKTLRLTLLIILTHIVTNTGSAVVTIWYMLDRTSASNIDDTLEESVFIIVVATSVLNPLIYSGTVGRKKRCKDIFHSPTWSRCFLERLCCLCGKCETCSSGAMNTDTIVVNRRGSEKSQQIVTLNRNAGIALRIVKAFSNSVDNASNEPEIDREYLEDKDDCNECASNIATTTHCIIPDGASFSFLNSTPV